MTVTLAGPEPRPAGARAGDSSSISSLRHLSASGGTAGGTVTVAQAGTAAEAGLSLSLSPLPVALARGPGTPSPTESELAALRLAAEFPLNRHAGLADRHG